MTHCCVSAVHCTAGCYNRYMVESVCGVTCAANNKFQSGPASKGGTLLPLLSAGTRVKSELLNGDVTELARCCRQETMDEHEDEACFMSASHLLVLTVECCTISRLIRSCHPTVSMITTYARGNEPALSAETTRFRIGRLRPVTSTNSLTSHLNLAMYQFSTQRKVRVERLPRNRDVTCHWQAQHANMWHAPESAPAATQA
jgi:hypothetical protein